MSSQPSLPAILDFKRDRSSDPARMNAAMEYLLADVRRVAALKPEFDAAIEELRTVGLSRLVEGLEPVFDRANEILAALETIFAAYGGNANPLDGLKAELLGEMDARAEALDQDRLTPDEAAIAANTAAIAALAADRWFLLHG